MAVTAVNMKEAGLIHEQIINKDIRLKYNSRSTQDQHFGMGWKMINSLQKLQAAGYRFDSAGKTGNIQTIYFKNKPIAEFLYIDNNLSQLSYAQHSYSFKYDEFNNMTEIRKNQKLLHKILYDNSRDWVIEVRSPNSCLRQFNYNQGLEGGPRLVSSQITKICPQKKIETQLFQFIKKSKLASGDNE
jgi:hypothetical protein